MSARQTLDLSVYLVLGRSDCRRHGLEEVVARALAGGATLVQLREKELPAHDYLELARSLLPLLEKAGVPLMINDRVEEAVVLGAAEGKVGLHVGQGDQPALEVRARVGHRPFLGLSVRRPEEAMAAPVEAVDHLGVGPVYATTTKANAAAPIGPAGVAAVRAVTALPLVGIGGITIDRAPEVIAAGAQGVAVVSAITGSDDPEAATARLARAVADSKRLRRRS
ncbi:thiamine phosphate synthase [Algihabitans albus]|uniref:thiamine phosphate synthase n=1 Tax=Algihabitans albus TaxID=2164067 RepID=UPI000E5D1A06|nr:thiamine phosphate synthase [Algihabitans albus]